MRRGYLTPPVIIILALITFGVALTLFFNTNLLKNIKNQPPEPSIQTQPSPIPDASREPNGSAETANWKTFTNQDFKFSLKYPPNYKVGDTVGETNDPSSLF